MIDTDRITELRKVEADPSFAGHEFKEPLTTEILLTLEKLWRVVEESTAFLRARRINCMAPQMGRHSCMHCRWEKALRELDGLE